MMSIAEQIVEATASEDHYRLIQKHSKGKPFAAILSWHGFLSDIEVYELDDGSLVGKSQYGGWHLLSDSMRDGEKEGKPLFNLVTW